VTAIFTIGHSNHGLGGFLQLLALHSIQAVADVRSQPSSRLHPHFDRGALKSHLKAVGIDYVFLGRELGGRPEDRECYDQFGQVDYDAVARTPSFAAGMDRLGQGAERYRVVLLCSEKDPITCHRMLLVSRRWFERGGDALHIRADGALEGQESAEARLMHEVGLSSSDMFRSPEEIRVEAFHKRAKEVAYRRSQASSGGARTGHR
jgi:uncharacterized protein (DUF488 family)